MEKIIQDKELGKIIIRPNTRARSIILRTRPDAIYMTVPPGATPQNISDTLEKFRHKLSIAKKKVARKRIDFAFSINVPFFKLTITSGVGKQFLANSSPGVMTIITPPNTNFDDEKLQEWLRKVIEESLRKNATHYLPNELLRLAKSANLTVSEVKINASKGRWGSCSMRKSINLSFYLMLLPEHLIHYVLWHELCHTIEMNHSGRFWALLDVHTHGQAIKLREELKRHKTEL